MQLKEKVYKDWKAGKVGLKEYYQTIEFLNEQAKQIFEELQDLDVASEDDYFVRIELEDYRKIKAKFFVGVGEVNERNKSK